MTATILGDAVLIVAMDPNEIEPSKLLAAPPGHRRVLALLDPDQAQTRRALPWLRGLVDVVVLLPNLQRADPERRALAAATLRTALA